MAIDPRLLEELEQRQKKIKYAATQEKYDARHAKGDWTARERIATLFDSGSFTEIGMPAFSAYCWASPILWACM